MENRFIIISPTYNAEDWIERNIESVQSQSYSNFKSVIINDISTDRTVKMAKNAIGDDPRFEVITNANRSRPLGSTVNGLKHAKPADEDVVIILDGDDWLYDELVFNKLNDAYNKEDCLFTYGSYIDFPNEQRGIFSQDIPEEIIRSNSYRRNQLLASHLKSFKYKLWKKIDHKDLVDFTGAYYPMAGDISYIFPMLEMAGSRAKYIEDILYVYNAYNPLNEHKTNHELQLSIESDIRSKAPYSYVEDFA